MRGRIEGLGLDGGRGSDQRHDEDGDQERAAQLQPAETLRDSHGVFNRKRVVRGSRVPFAAPIPALAVLLEPRARCSEPVSWPSAQPAVEVPSDRGR